MGDKILKFQTCGEIVGVFVKQVRHDYILEICTLVGSV